MKLKLFVFAYTILFVQSLLAQSLLAENRFDNAIKKVKQSFQNTFDKNKNFDQMSAAKQAAAFSISGVRINAFNLQSLGRIYQTSEDKKLRKFAILIRDATKSLEDDLGTVDMYANVSKAAEQDKAAKKLLKSLKAKNWIKDNRAGDIFSTWYEEMKNINWPTDNEDHDFVLSVMKDQLDTISNTNYDMSRLNSGMHELRRELRWFGLYVIASSGLVQKSNESEFACQQESLPFKEFADPKYSYLPSEPDYPGTCYLSACLYDEIVGAVGIFGLLKDKSEKIVEHNKDLLKSDANPEETRAEAVKYYQLLSKTQILQKAMVQLKACAQ